VLSQCSSSSSFYTCFLEIWFTSQNVCLLDVTLIWTLIIQVISLQSVPYSAFLGAPVLASLICKWQTAFLNEPAVRNKLTETNLAHCLVSIITEKVYHSQKNVLQNITASITKLCFTRFVINNNIFPTVFLSAKLTMNKTWCLEWNTSCILIITLKGAISITVIFCKPQSLTVFRLYQNCLSMKYEITLNLYLVDTESSVKSRPMQAPRMCN